MLKRISPILYSRSFLVSCLFLIATGSLANALDGSYNIFSTKYVKVFANRADKIYVVGETAVVRVETVTLPANGSFQLNTEAYTLDGPVKKYLKRVVDEKVYLSQYSLKLTQATEVHVETFMVNEKLRADLFAQIEKMNNQLVRLNQIVISDPTPENISRRDSLVASLATAQQQYSSTKTLVQSDSVSLATTANDVVLNVTSPLPGAVSNSGYVEVKGQFNSTISELKVFVNSQEVFGAKPDEEFFFSAAQEGMGSSNVIVEVRRGPIVLSKKEVNYSFIPKGSAASEVGNLGGESAVLEPTSSLNGAKVFVPQGAVDGTRNIIISYASSSRQVPKIFQEVSERFTFQPYLMFFEKNVSITIPIKAGSIPAGRSYNEVKILALIEDAWVTIPHSSVDSAKIVFQTTDFEYDCVIAVLPLPLNSGEISLQSNIAGATIYVDEVFKGNLTPTILSGITSGSHDIKIFKEGFDEYFQSINFSSPLALFVELKPSIKFGASVEIGPSLTEGMKVSNSLIQFSGQVVYPGHSLDLGKLIVSVNSYDSLQTIAANGTFSAIAPLFEGANTIQVRYTIEGRTVSSKTYTVIRNSVSMVDHQLAFPSVYSDTDVIQDIRMRKILSITESPVAIARPFVAETSNQEIRVVMTWNKADTDVDLHIQELNGGHAYYGHPTGILGGNLDKDDVDGFGPETFVLAKPRPGEYAVSAQYYSDHGKGATNIVFKIFLDGKLLKTDSKVLSTGGSWNVFTIKIGGEITITDLSGAAGKSKENLKTQCGSANVMCVPGRFVVGEDENKLKVTTEADETILDSDITYEVTDVNSGLPVQTDAKGRNALIVLPRVPVSGFGRISFPKMYKVQAKTPTAESYPFLIVQDERSQIRQEYFDFKEYRKSFDKKYTLGTPKYEEVQDGRGFSGSSYYNYQKFLVDADYGNFGEINLSKQYANLVNAKYLLKNKDHPTLRLTSAWRNPRNQWALASQVPGSAVDSGHLRGDAVDFGVHLNLIPKMKNRDLEYRRQLLALCNTAAEAIPGNVQVMVHNNNHVHIESFARFGVRAIRCSEFKVSTK